MQHKSKDILFPWDTLLKWYKKHGRKNLPWREYDAYKDNQKSLLYIVWIAEILLQQTQAERVIAYLNRILKRFPDVESLAKTDYDTFFPYYQGMGYYSRARNILKTAKIINEEYDGIFPSDTKLLTKLPGVGKYTSSAISGFGYGIPMLTWDTNLEKVFSRYIHGRKDIPLTRDEKNLIENNFIDYIENIASKEQKVCTVRSINNALMDFARLVDNKNPDNIDWENYPIQSGVFYTTRGKLEPKIGKKGVRFPIADAHVVVILHENHNLYYSSQEDVYIPYILEGIGDTNTRQYVQSYFREKYGIELSVRPIHKKWMGADNIAYIAVYAQIQIGILNTKRFSKYEVQENLKQYKK